MRASAWSVASLVWLLLAGLVCPAWSQAPAVFSRDEPAAEAKAGKELHALRLGASTIRIDGRVDDEPWMRASA